MVTEPNNNTDKKDIDTRAEDFTQFISSASELYPEFTSETARELYNYNAIAFKACERYVGDVMKQNYDITGGIKTYEEELDLKSVLKTAAKYAYRDGYSLVYLKFTDKGNYIDAVTQKQVPEGLEVIPKSWVISTIDDYNVDGERQNYYEIRQKQGTPSIKIHESRIMRVYFRDDKQSMFLPAWRSLWMSDLTMWNVGQAYFRTAGGMYHLVLKNKGRAAQKSVKKVTEDSNMKKLDSSTLFVSGEDKELKNVGINGGFPDPQKSYEIPLMTAATGLKIPWQLLVGTNAGAVTGSETNIKEYFSSVQNFRTIWVTNIINTIELMCGLTKSSVIYGTLFEETDLEKAEMIKSYADAFKPLITLGVYSKEGVNDYMNKQLGIDLPLGEVITSQVNQTIATVKDIAQPKFKPNQKSRLESEIVIVPEDKQTKKQQSLLNKYVISYDFSKEVKKAYSQINVKDSLFDKSIYLDSTDKLKGLIDIVVDTFKYASIEEITNYFDATWALGLSIAFKTIKKDNPELKNILPTQRTENINSIMRSGIGDKIVGATDDMKKDLKRVLQEGILTGTNPTTTAKEFKKYVTEDFTNKYKNRLQVIVQTETGNIIGQANIREMEDSGVVEYQQWITAQDSRVRPKHRINGEVVKLGGVFSNGLSYGGQEIMCRCDTVPYYHNDRE